MHSVFHLVIALFCFNCRGGNHTAQEDWLFSYHWLVGFIGWVLCAWLELFTHTSSGNVWFWLCLSCSDLSQTHWPLRLCSFFAARVTLGPLTGASRSTLPLLHPLAYLLHLTSSSGETTAHSLLHQLHTFFFFLRRLKVFGASQNIMFLFYQAVTESVIRYWMTVWFGSLSTQSKSAAPGTDCYEGDVEDWQALPLSPSMSSLYSGRHGGYCQTRPTSFKRNTSSCLQAEGTESPKANWTVLNTLSHPLSSKF